MAAVVGWADWANSAMLAGMAVASPSESRKIHVQGNAQSPTMPSPTLLVAIMTVWSWSATAWAAADVLVSEGPSRARTCWLVMSWPVSAAALAGIRTVVAEDHLHLRSPHTAGGVDLRGGQLGRQDRLRSRRRCPHRYWSRRHRW